LRYAALVLQRYLKRTSDAEVTPRMKQKYSTPIPVEAVFTRKECSATYSDLMELQQAYGFEYAAAMGSFIYLMNTYIGLNYGTRTWARFIQNPGRNHFKTLLHLGN
jgi:hypothetical protein